MTKNARNTLIILLGILAVLLLGLLFILLGRTTDNPLGTVGNTGGNLNNSGLFCEYNGKVYFSNSDDGGSLYSMNPDETNVKRLNTMSVRNILAGGDYLYFYQVGTAHQSGFGQIQGMRSFNRSKLNGKDSKALTKAVVITAQLVDNYIYMLTSENSKISFGKMKTDKSKQVTLANTNINPACAVDGNIYYNGVDEDHYLYSLNTSNDTTREVWKGNVWYPIAEGDYVYYMDVANNYRLCRYVRSQDVIEVLTNDRVDCYNIRNGYIYYQKNGTDAALICMRTDGSDRKVIAPGNYTDINMTSRYVYFKAFGNELLTYHSPLGSDYYNGFHPVVE